MKMQITLLAKRRALSTAAAVPIADDNEVDIPKQYLQNSR
jgi:hypothetical protein